MPAEWRVGGHGLPLTSRDLHPSLDPRVTYAKNRPPFLAALQSTNDGVSDVWCSVGGLCSRRDSGLGNLRRLERDDEQRTGWLAFPRQVIVRLEFAGHFYKVACY